MNAKKPHERNDERVRLLTMILVACLTLATIAA